MTPEEHSHLSHSISPIYPTFPYHCSHISHNRLLQRYSNCTHSTGNLPHRRFLPIHTTIVRMLLLRELHTNWVDKHEVMLEIRGKGEYRGPGGGVKGADSK